MANWRESPCKECHEKGENFTACHDVCEKFQKAKTEWLEKQKQIKEAKAKDWGYDRYHYERIQVTRKIGREKGKRY